MELKHPDPTILESFCSGELPREQENRIEQHLLVCEACEERYLELLHDTTGLEPRGEAGDGEEPADYSETIDRVVELARATLREHNESLAEEQESAASLVAEVLSLPVDERRKRVREDRRFRGWRLCEQLLAASVEEGLASPRDAVSLGEAGIELASRLDEAVYGQGRAEDLRARAWACLANARRTTSDLRGAEEAFEQAEEHLRQGTGDPLELARFLDLKSSLRRAQRRLEDAGELLDEAIHTYRLLSEGQLIGRALLKKGLLLGLWGEHKQAAEILRESLERTDEEAEPRLALHTRHNLAQALLESGQLLEAQAMIGELRRAHRELGDPLNRLRLRWLEARLALAMGRKQDAESLFLETRDGFVEAGVGYDAALVSLDLASLYAAQGRTEELKRLAGELIPIFQSRDVDREALAALILFQQAAHRERVTAELIDQVAGQIQGSSQAPRTSAAP